MLNSVDLFTGIGGFTLALKGYAKPLLYCDKDKNVIKLLHKLTASGKLPRAPVVEDVKNLSAIRDIVGKKTVHVLTAGFPCVGFSKIGDREGLLNDQSSLFHDTMKVIRATKPRMVFLENVREIMSANGGSDIKHIFDALKSAGYHSMWTTCSAEDAGAPHLRRRWFSLSVLKGYAPPPFVFRKLNSWSLKSMPPLIVDHNDTDSGRSKMLGNAIVPHAARLALTRLLSNFEGCESKESRLINGAHGRYGDTIEKVFVPSVQRVDHQLIVTPGHYKTVAAYRHHANRTPSPLIKGKFRLKIWPTPRATLATHAHVLSERTVRDLPTLAMYVSGVRGRAQAPTIDGQNINPVFVEWLMGFPKGWTA